MNFDYQITNQKKFNENVINIDLEGIRFQNNGVFSGTVSIETENGWKDITGEHGSRDYEGEYGFIIIRK